MSPVKFTPFRAGLITPCVSVLLWLSLLETDILTIRDAAVGIVGIVVVQSTIRIDVANIVSVRGVGSPHPPIPGWTIVVDPHYLLQNK